VSDFDPRITPARPDLAAEHLRGRVEAARFVAGEAREVIDAQAPVRRAPSPDAEQMTEALLGERVTVYEFNAEGWAWGQLDADGYVGWLPANALVAPREEPTHVVTALRTFAFPGPSIKLPPVAVPPLGSRIAVLRKERPLSVCAIGYVPNGHIARIGWLEEDFVAVAERFVGTPYLWGGKTSYGIDCSGLVQVALAACGIACPRDSDMQETALGSGAQDGDLQRGDLLFWKGHVAIVRDDATLVHANAHHMAVTIEPVADVMARAAESGSAVTSVRRIG
jgi:hypothetical protein